MKRKLMKYAMLHIADLAEKEYPDDPKMTSEKFMKEKSIQIDYWEDKIGSRIRGKIVILEAEEIIAGFEMIIPMIDYH